MEPSGPEIPETTPNQQQNVYLHMHHVCTCQNFYQTYYTPIGYRAPLITYTTPQTIPRPYLQPYQYNQYSMPITHLPTCRSGANLGYTTTHQQTETNLVTPPRQNQDRGDSQEDSTEIGGTQTEAPPGFEVWQVTPPSASDLLLTNNSDDAQTNIENFVKFLERGCLTAEQIAYRNRNRPCFRNIKNLCVRTRTEILKPCATPSNIHSQGIPWVTKDFIYAFIRLTNCWHILRGYWEYRDGSALGKVEKVLTPEFRASYIRWEKASVELATQLARIFYDLDTNLNSATGATSSSSANGNSSNVKSHLANNLVPPQIYIPKNSGANGKNLRPGILHLPETVDQANQTSFNPGNDSDNNSGSTMYMKPGSYHTPKKLDDDEPIEINKNIPVIEFLETAQNVNKGLEMTKYWTKIKTKVRDTPESGDNELNHDAALYNVRDWLSSSCFNEFPEPPTSNETSHHKLIHFLDNVYKQELEGPVKPAITLLQKDTKSADNKNSCVEIPSRTYRRKTVKTSREIKDEGLNQTNKRMIENLLEELKSTELAQIINDYDLECPNLDTISSDLDKDRYLYVNEVVKDLRYMIDYLTIHVQKFNCSKEKVKLFSHKLETGLIIYFPNCDFGEMKGAKEVEQDKFDGDGNGFEFF